MVFKRWNSLRLEARPSLVISDVLMPRMGGIEFANKVHDDPAIAQTPIIFYTATYRTTEARELAASCNVFAVLAKPAEPDVILDAVADALGLAAPPRTEKKSGSDGKAIAAFTVDPSAPQDHSLHLRLATLLELNLALSSERDPREMLVLFCRAAQGILGGIAKWASASACLIPTASRTRRSLHPA